MNFTVEDGISGLPEDTPLLFYRKGYAKVQQYKKLQVYKALIDRKPSMMLLAEIKDEQATSLPGSPFGSFLLLQDVSIETVKKFLAYITGHLRRKMVKTLDIVQPSPIFGPFPRLEAFQFFHLAHQDLNQHIDLRSNFESSLHSMEARKLKAAIKNGIECLEEDHAALPQAHQFIAECREQNGLKINISLDKLQALFKTFPDTYKIFSAYQGDQRLATTITCQVTPKIAYYYLPATAEASKHLSPMVPLLHHIASHYKLSGANTLDLGIASVEGKKQEGLFTFKERMGAIHTHKSTYRLQL